MSGIALLIELKRVASFSGSVIRVSPGCDRNLKCTSTVPMTYICIQAKDKSLEGYTMTDAAITERENLL